MIFNVDDIIEIHQAIIKATGGTKGIKDIGLLDSSVNSIYQTFNGKELYPTIVEKACWFCFSLNMNHAFIDGNKRISMHMLALYLRMHGVTYQPTNQEVIRVGLAISSRQMSYPEILCWVKDQIK